MDGRFVRPGVTWITQMSAVLGSLLTSPSRKEVKMKNRKRQRANHKLKMEMLHRKNAYGNVDLTPYEAVKKTIVESQTPRRPGVTT